MATTGLPRSSGSTPSEDALIRPFPTPCWNHLSLFQQGSIRLYGTVVADGHPASATVTAAATHTAPVCDKQGLVAVEVAGDDGPGARVYCPACAKRYLDDRFPD